MQIKISRASTPSQLALAKDMFEDNSEWLGIDLSFQGFTSELAALPGPYSSPSGRLLLALADNVIAGCVAVRPLGDRICEMKRLFVRSEFRGYGIGQQLVEAILKEARAIGYLTMRLDTLSSMQPAIRLYEKFGFIRRDAYYETPLPNTVFMELRLSSEF